MAILVLVVLLVLIVVRRIIPILLVFLVLREPTTLRLEIQVVRPVKPDIIVLADRRALLAPLAKPLLQARLLRPLAQG